ncbi:MULTISPECIES: DUF2149 domain-containing protein [unclassified Sphingosinithalassobacter]|uniref:DUF2149 domain-containing protein n=1 Tax=unclassified Sphingosinithalassobacter TaxID=2676235 RepID=UPI00165E7C56|nr:DUF2149 domain-containing protein [Sphingosinithalassobacter sp. CS137]
MRFLEDDEADDPILSVVNLVDLFLVILAVLMVIIARNPLNPFQSKQVVVVENPGQKDMTITVKDGEKLERYTSTAEMGDGGGVKAGVTYRLPDGSLVYVPEQQ